MDEIQKVKKSGDRAPQWFTNLVAAQASPMLMKAKDPYGLGYPGDYMPSMLGPFQYGPMTERQAKYHALLRERGAANREKANSVFGQLFRSGRPEPEEPGFLDFLLKIMQEKKP